MSTEQGAVAVLVTVGLASHCMAEWPCVTDSWAQWPERDMYSYSAYAPVGVWHALFIYLFKTSENV